jgi:hypothetical protein
MLKALSQRLARLCYGVPIAASVLLAACGGGGGTPSETATSYTHGQITGYGSIIVNGVRFDDRHAVVVDDDDREGLRNELKIGMWVEVEAGGVDRERGVGRALRVRWANEFVGPVSSVDAGASTFVLFGQTIEVRPATQFEDLPAGLASLAPGDVVEVHGYFNAATSRYVATRVEAEDDADHYKLRGIVSGLDTTARTFRLGTETIYYGGVTDLPANLADGLRVRVRLLTEQNAAGQWVAVRVKHGVRRPTLDRVESEIEGVVDTCTSNTSFSVNGIAVDASTAVFRDGFVTCGDEVEVKGQIEGGVMKAAVVKREDDDEGLEQHELHGTIVSVDTSAETFVLRHDVHGEISVSYRNVLRFEDGTRADLVPGAQVEVRGRFVLGGVLQAARVEFED